MSLTTVSGRAVDLSDCEPLITLKSVRVSGADRGIVLQNRSGHFNVVGDGSATGSGGLIQSISQNGLELANAQNVYLA